MSEQKTEQRPEAFWRDATAKDVAKVMKGEKVEARFRDGEGTSWYLRKLVGWNTGLFRCDRAEGWKQCQVYDPPQWWLDKPDPGEGWRLLEKFPDEPKLATDEAWDPLIREWRVTATDNGIQYEEVWYRRRIEPVEPTLLGHYVLQVGDLVTLPNGQTISITAKGFKVY